MPAPKEHAQVANVKDAGTGQAGHERDAGDTHHDRGPGDVPPSCGATGAVGHHRRPKYQSVSAGPTVTAVAAPIARKHPNGSAYFIVPRPVTISPRPITEPDSDASINVSSVSFQPRNPPIIASIFGSPMPSPSSSQIQKYAIPANYTPPPPPPTPKTHSPHPRPPT